MAEKTARNARIASVVAATAVALGCGTNYAYSAWGPDFAKRMQISATQSNAIGAAGNVGTYAMGIPAGMVVDNTSPRIGVLVGAAALAAGYFPIHKAFDEGPGSISVSLLCFCCFLTGMGSCIANTAAIKTATYNWPSHRGTASAIPLSAFGLSAFFFTTVANIMFGDSTSSYLLMLAVGTTSLNLVSFFFLRLIPSANGPIAAINDDGRPGVPRQDSSRMRYRSSSSDSTRVGRDEEGNENDSLVSRLSTPSDLDEEELPKHSHDLPFHVEVTGLKLLSQFKFWQLFGILGLLSGVGIMTINNIGNDAGSLWKAYDGNAPRSFVHEREQFHVGVLSICSFLGRLLSGAGSDILIKRLHASRLWCLVVSAVVFVLAQLCALLIENPNLLFFVSSLSGLAYGMLFGVMPSLIADGFGVHGLSLNWGFIIFAPVITGNIFNICYGRILDGNSTNGECTKGLGCYASAYWVTLASSSVAVLLGLWCIRYDAVMKRKVMHGRIA